MYSVAAGSAAVACPRRRCLGVGPGVGAAEDQASFDGVQLGEPPALLGRREIALHPGLEGAARGAAAERARECVLGPFARLIQQVVKHIDVRLFLADGTRGLLIELAWRDVIFCDILSLDMRWRGSRQFLG